MENIKIPWPEWKATRKLGHGSFGTVYEIERDVYGHIEKAALKVISVPQSQDEIDSDYSEGYDVASIRSKYESIRNDVVKEYQLMSELRGNPNVVSCDDVQVESRLDEIGWDIYIRMELLTSLQAKLRKGNLSDAEVLKLGKDICNALVACEEKNIIHRDIKPENIMISEYGIYKIGDFGVARTMDHTTNATKAGTERYMAPEIIKREKYGKEVDTYSLGMVMYWLLNRRRVPFVPIDRIPTADENSEAQYRRVNGEQLPPPIDGSDGLRQVVLKACAYEKKDRYSSAKEMLRDLNSVKDASNVALGGEENRTKEISNSSEGTERGTSYFENVERIPQNVFFNNVTSTEKEDSRAEKNNSRAYKYGSITIEEIESWMLDSDSSDEQGDETKHSVNSGGEVKKKDFLSVLSINKKDRSFWLKVIVAFLVIGIMCIRIICAPKELYINDGSAVKIGIDDSCQVDVYGEGLTKDDYRDIVWKIDNNYVLTEDNGKFTAHYDDLFFSEGKNARKDKSLMCEVPVTASIKKGMKNWSGECLFEVVLKPEEIENGQIVQVPKGNRDSSITFTSSKNEDAYVFLKSTSGSEKDLAFYVKKGSTVTIPVPKAKYNIYTASGDTWFGKQYLFGPNTKCYKDKEITDFRNYTWTYEMNDDTNGSVSTIINQSNFPK